MCTCSNSVTVWYQLKRVFIFTIFYNNHQRLRLYTNTSCVSAKMRQRTWELLHQQATNEWRNLIGWCVALCFRVRVGGQWRQQCRDYQRNPWWPHYRRNRYYFYPYCCLIQIPPASKFHSQMLLRQKLLYKGPLAIPTNRHDVMLPVGGGRLKSPVLLWLTFYEMPQLSWVIGCLFVRSEWRSLDCNRDCWSNRSHSKNFDFR